MAYDVASSINELLLKNNSVIIPGFGGFELQLQPANIDHIKSTISPPNRTPIFNKKLKINDGVLVDFVQTKNLCSLEQANKMVEDFVTEIKAKIERKEIVEFPQVGRIYKDYNKKLQFLPFETNFNTSSFGLPTIDIHPFSRSESIKKESASVAAAALDLNKNQPSAASSKKSPMLSDPLPEPEPQQTPEEVKVTGIPVNEKKKFFRLAEMTMPLLFLAAIALIALTYFMLREDGSPKLANNNQEVLPREVSDDRKVNEKPDFNSIDESETTELPNNVDSENDKRLQQDINSGNNSTSEDSEESIDYASTDNDNDSSDQYSTDEECIIIVGQFGSKRNVRRMIQKVEAEGYEAYSGWNDKKQLNMVGAKFIGLTDDEKEEKIKELNQKYEINNAWILGE